MNKKEAALKLTYPKGGGEENINVKFIAQKRRCKYFVVGTLLNSIKGNQEKNIGLSLSHFRHNTNIKALSRLGIQPAMLRASLDQRRFYI